jgi:hypothetical protein
MAAENGQRSLQERLARRRLYGRTTFDVHRFLTVMDRGFRCSDARDVPWPLDSRRSVRTQPNCIRWSGYRSANCADRLAFRDSCYRDDVSSRRDLEGPVERENTSSTDLRMERRKRGHDMLRRIHLCCGFSIRRFRGRRSTGDEPVPADRLSGSSPGNTTVAFRQASQVSWLTTRWSWRRSASR